LHQRRATFSDLIFVVGRCIKDFQHNTGTVFCRNGVSTNGLKNSKVVAQVLCMRTELDAHPPSTGKLMLAVFGTHKAQYWNIIREVHDNKQCLLQWDAYWPTKACNSKQMPRTTVEGCCVAWRCLSTYCYPPYSPDAASSDCQLFGPLKEALTLSGWVSKYIRHCCPTSFGRMSNYVHTCLFCCSPFIFRSYCPCWLCMRYQRIRECFFCLHLPSGSYSLNFLRSECHL
jgi:hypothetical protein